MPSKAAIIDKQAAKRFKLVRKYLKLNQGEMAELCEISQGMVSFIEANEREIPQNALKILFLKKNISPLYVIAGVGSIEHKKEEAGSQLITNLRDMKAEMEIMKARINLLFKT